MKVPCAETTFATANMSTAKVSATYHPHAVAIKHNLAEDFRDLLVEHTAAIPLQRQLLPLLDHLRPQLHIHQQPQGSGPGWLMVRRPLRSATVSSL